jgi:hypothetical protein
MCARRVGWGESLLAEGDCQEILEGVHYAGRLVLTTRRVRFAPTPLMRVAGGEPWEISLDALQSAVLGGADRRLTLTTAHGSRVLSGVGARALHEVLAPLLSAGRPMSVEGRERVLVATDTEIEVNDLVSARGELVLTTRRLRFEPARLERSLWPRLAFELPVDSIRGCAVVGLRRRLEVRAATRVLRFLGPVIPELYGALHAVAALGPGGVGEPEYDVTPVSLVRGPLMHPGALVRTHAGLCFIATGVLDALVGLEHVLELPVQDITRMSITGLIDKGIEVTTTTGRAVFSCPGIEELFSDLTVWWSRSLPGPVWSGERTPDALEGRGAGRGLRLAPPPMPDPAAAPPPALRALIEDVLSQWRTEHPLPAAPVLFSPAVRLGDAGDAAPGWLLVGDDTLVWLPRFGDQGPLRLALGGTVALRRDAPPGAVHVQVGAGRLFRWLVPVEQFRTALTEKVDRPARPPAPSLRPAPVDPFYRGGNRRQTFRVLVRAEEERGLCFWLLDRGEMRPFGGSLADFSLHGFALKLATPFAGPTMLQVGIPFGDDEVRSLEATLVHQRKLKDEDCWLAGWRFEGSWGEVEFLTHNLWLELQQRAIRRNAEDAGAAS